MVLSDNGSNPNHGQRQGVQKILSHQPHPSHQHLEHFYPPEGYEPVRVLAQDGHGAMLRPAKDLLLPGKKPPIYWIFETGFISDLLWDPEDWHWQKMQNMGDAPFFGYSAKSTKTPGKSSTPLTSPPSSNV